MKYRYVSGGFVISDNPVKPGLHPGDERVIWAGIFRRYLRVEFGRFRLISRD